MSKDETSASTWSRVWWDRPGMLVQVSRLPKKVASEAPGGGCRRLPPQAPEVEDLFFQMEARILELADGRGSQ